ncbi:CGNR zinc finger domain-containing protein [Streptomyces sp. NPDC012888]|uniref:CGNR zinc finger domain-containing protein n=1 Tax=Streptomyces sp. NPDC012888 TaxID=3364855 RepID=UPI00367E90CB
MNGFHPAARLVDLAEAVRNDPEAPRDTLAALLARHGEHPGDLGEGAFTEADAAELRAAARRMGAVLAETDTDRAALALNAVFDECAARPRLSSHDGHPWHLHADREGSGWGDWFLAAGALALAELLSAHGRVAWGACPAAGCGRYFLGTGPGSPRRYCSTSCATRARVAAHRRRAAADAPRDGG